MKNILRCVAEYGKRDKPREKGSEISAYCRINEPTERRGALEGKGGTGGRDRNGGWKSRAGGTMRRASP